MHRAPNHTYAGHFNALNCFPSFRSLSTTRNQNRYREKEGAAGVLFATGKPFMCSTRPRLQTSMETYNISDRPPRKITLGEIGFPDPNLMAHVNLSKPLMGTLGPIVASFLSFLMGRGFTKGTPYRIHDVMIPLKGPKVGIKSAVDLYFPRKVYDKRLKCPTIIIRTPYWKDMTQVIGQYLAQNGYVVVFQDIRGTGHSEGYNSFLFLERDDALSIMEWLKKAFWYNGRISTWGASYLGMTQYVIWDNEDMTCFNVQISSPRNIWSIHQGLFPNELGAHIARIFCKGKFRDQPPEAMEFDPTSDPPRSPEPNVVVINPATGRIDFGMLGHPNRSQLLGWGVDYIDIVNENDYDNDSIDFFHGTGVGNITGTDMHSPGTVHGWTQLSVPAFTEEAIFAALKARNTSIIYNNTGSPDHSLQPYENPAYTALEPIIIIGDTFENIYDEGVLAIVLAFLYLFAAFMVGEWLRVLKRRYWQRANAKNENTRAPAG